MRKLASIRRIAEINPIEEAKILNEILMQEIQAEVNREIINQIVKNVKIV